MTLESGDAQTLQREQEMLRSNLQQALHAVTGRARRYRQLNLALVLVTILSGATVTLLGADAARGGTRVAQRVAESTTGRTPPPLGQGWRNVCGVMAILAFVGTIASGVNTALKVSERNVRAFACVGVIDGLLTELPDVSSAGRPLLDRARTELARVRREYPEFFR